MESSSAVVYSASKKNYIVHDHLTGQQCQEQFIKKWKTITVSENRSVEAEKYWKELTAAITVKRYSPDNSNPSASKSSKTPAQNAIKTKLEVMNSE
ncbi:hypothetical protein OUZ56_016483 [Daphnia magna]|uniref:Uncharacterized protein n=1 Tax=Daphnia magna TaxID=35525 RepID=A0ABR0AQP3_9CRUS|nr:hypothetical protein OUZ56_016483 [Daphnia magna]